MKLDAKTIFAIAEKAIALGSAAYGSFKKAAADAGADDATLRELDRKYDALLAHEQAIAGGTDVQG